MPIDRVERCTYAALLNKAKMHLDDAFSKPSVMHRRSLRSVLRKLQTRSNFARGEEIINNSTKNTYNYVGAFL